MVAAITSFFAVGTGFYHSPADQFFLYLQINVFRNNGFVAAFYIVLRNKPITFNSGLVKKVGGVGLLKQGITDVFLVSENFVDGACVPFFPPAPVRIPSRSRPAAILSILRPSKCSR